MLIGCHALHRQRVLVTQNLREFERLQGLSVEDWSGSS
jgi:predicted nucleic acid-binding protein